MNRSLEKKLLQCIICSIVNVTRKVYVVIVNEEKQ